MLKLPMEDVKTMFSALIREAAPITFRGDQLDVRLDEARVVITTAFWSKWHGKGVRVAVGRSEHLTSNDAARLVERRELENTCGVVVATDDSYETYAL
jgi:hypothetical protein